MAVQKKIIWMYSLFVIILAAVLSAVFYSYTSKRYMEAEYENLQVLARKNMQQFDENIRQMEQIADYLLSDMDVLNAMEILGTVTPDSPQKKSYCQDAAEIIQSRLNAYYMTKNFHRVIYFNEMGSVIASKDYSTFIIDRSRKIDELPWFDQIQNSYGDQVLIGEHIDDWSIKAPIPVFSTVKKVYGVSHGYIEVQNAASMLATVFESGNPQVDVVVLKANGSYFYSNKETNENNIQQYYGLEQLNPGGILEWKNPDTARIEVYTIVESQDQKAVLYLFKDKGAIMQEAAQMAAPILYIALALGLVSVVYIIFVVRFLMRTQRLSILQLQAQFDSLQAQVNPHFLYNVLNVISSRGMDVGDEQICDICHNLASMLRFSTDTTHKIVTIGEEEAYVRQYFYLLKARYDYKLDYDINIVKEIQPEKMPKIVLQQIVENSIAHGFSEKEGTMRIQITGWESDGWWYIRVSDNGRGFRLEDLMVIQEKMAQTREQMLNRQKNIEMEIGGLGLVNAYARLLLIKGSRVKFELENGDAGARVTFGAVMEAGEKMHV